jgi:type IV secretion system protein VirB9
MTPTARTTKPKTTSLGGFSAVYRLILAATLLGLGFSARSEAIPQAGPSDKRIKVVNYNPHDVVLVVGRFGYATDIQLNDDEKITQVALGDSSAWSVSPVGQHLFLKPRLDDARTNMIVLTDKNRTYNFILRTAAANGKGVGAGDDQFFTIDFRYPAEQAKQVASTRDAEALKEKLAHPVRQIRNVQYFGCGDPSVTPDQAFDDGRFTFLRFSGNRKMPAVFSVDDTGSESIVNSHVEQDSPDTIVVHQLAKKLVFRLGKAVGCVVNKAYDPKGVNNFNGTVSKDVERVSKGQQ